MRPLCYVPEGGAVVETCTRAVQGRLLLRPGPAANEIMLGVLGRAVDYYKVELYGFAFASSHVHLLYRAESALQMARFQNYFNGNLARELGRLHDWREKFWGRRYRPMLIGDEPDAQLARLEYLLAHGTKEHLVESPLEWPGPNMARSLLLREPLVGHWFNRTKEWAARRRGEDFGRYDYATGYEIQLQPLPAHRDLSAEEYRELIARLVHKIQEESAEKRDGRPVLGVERVLAENPHNRPSKVKKSPAPMLFFAKSKDLLASMREAYHLFVAEYREAADRLKLAQSIGGWFDPTVEFPPGSFPPALQFVGATLEPPPGRPPTRRLEYDDSETVRRIVGRGEVPVVRVPRRSLLGTTGDVLPPTSARASGRSPPTSRGETMPGP